MSKIPDRVLNTFWRWGNESVRLRLELREAQKETDALKAENEQLKDELEKSKYESMQHQHSAECLDVLYEAEKEKNERLKTERDAAVEDFQDYATQGSENFAPFCANADKSCVDSRGYCIYGKCKGRKWRGIKETPRTGIIAE